MQPSHPTKRLVPLFLILLVVLNGCLPRPATPTAMQQALSPLTTEGEIATASQSADSAYAAIPEEAASESGALSAKEGVVDAIPLNETMVDPMGVAPEGTRVAFRNSSEVVQSLSAYSPANPVDRTTQYEPVTAGVTDDNTQWNDYLAYLTRQRGLWVKTRDVSERYVIRVVDQHALPVHDALVEIFTDDQLLFTGRTDAGGQLLFHPRALDSGYWQRQAGEYRVKASKGWVAQSQNFARYNAQSGAASGNDQWTLTLNDPPRRATTQLDLLFLIDATGSMGDEIDKLKASMADVADQIARLPEQPNVRYGLVAYRDRGDAFVVQPHDFTYDLSQFQHQLGMLAADGGGDIPEALNEALHRSIHELSWRDDETVRMILLVADAQPHLDYADEPFSYDTDMIEAVRQGMKVFPIGASGLEPAGEYIFRQLAQFTGGKFVFLTYADGSNPSSGPGTETNHEVENYSVDTLDRLVVRLVREELAKLVRVQTGAQLLPTPQPSPLPTPTFTPTPQPQSLSCTVDLAAARHDCDRIGAIRLLAFTGNQALYQITLDPQNSGYARARFDITYGGVPSGWSVNLGDSISNDGDGGDGGQQSNDAEVQIVNGNLLVYGNDDTPPQVATDGQRLLLARNDIVRASETIALEVSNGRLGISAAGGMEAFDSPYLFALNRQPDREGATNHEIYAAFNRVIAGGRDGSGVAQVVITLYPGQ